MRDRPSRLHRWLFLQLTDRTGAVEQCQRCGRHFVEKADATGPRHCFPTTQWQVSKNFWSITDTYLLLDLSFHGAVSDKWANGEEAWLDLETGNVESR